MAEDIEEEESGDELRQMQKLKTFRRLVQSVLRRRLIGLGIVFVITGALAATAVWWLVKHSERRFEAQTNLMFYPKTTATVKPFDNDQVMRILTRRVMAVRVAEELGLPADAAAAISRSFEVWQDSRNRNYYAIKATAPDYEEALRRANAYADAARKEYTAFRLEDLRSRRETIDRRKSEIAQETSRIDAEEDALSAELKIASPFAESDRLTGEISKNKQRLSETVFSIADCEARLKDVRSRLGEANPDVLDEADSVRRFTEKLAKCDEEIERLSLVYTDENPKLALAREERAGIAARYSAFLARYGMKNLSEGDLTRIDSLGKKAKAAAEELERLLSTRDAIEKEIAECQRKQEDILRVLPRYEGLKTRRDTLKAGRARVDEDDADIRFLEATVGSELTQIERCTRAEGASTFGRKKMLAVLAVAFLMTGIAAFVMFFLELLRGKVHDAAELTCYFGVEALGEEGGSREADEEAFIRFRSSLGEGRKLYLAPLGGSEAEKGFLDRFLLQCSLAGMKTLLVEIVRAKDYTPSDEDAMFTAVCYRGDRGRMPVVDPAGLSAMEIAMLKADLDMLVSDFDLVILKGPGDHRPGVLADQLSELCGLRLALVRPGRTSRRELRGFIAREGIRTMVLALRSVVLAAAFTCSGCYWSRLTGNFEQYPDLLDEPSAIVDESGLSPEQLEEQRKTLQALEDEPPEVYHINAGDRVRFIVYDHPDLCTDATVTPDGHLGIVFLGQVKVSDLTLTEACQKIEQGLSRYIKKPAVGITPLEISSQSCTIAGGVQTPGIYTISSSMRLADLYSKCGGSATRRINGDDLSIADMGNSYIFRNGKALPVDFHKAINEGNPLHNVRLKKNDYVYIGVRSESMVCVVGAVKRPHKQLFDDSLGLIELLTNAGWTEETYWPNVIIIRGGVTNPKMYKVDVDAILAGRRGNVRLQSGDVVYVPHDNLSEYNVFIRKLIPTGQLFNMLTSPFNTWSNFNSTNGAK